MREMNSPEHWKVERLGNVCNIVMGQSPPSTTYNDEGMGMPFLQGKAEFTELFPVPTKYCTKRIKVAPKGSVLMSVRAPVGNVNLADRKYIIGRGLTSISLKRGNNRFLFYLLLHNKKEIEAKGYGSIFKSINKTAINDFQISLPPLPEQRAIAHILQTIQEAKSTRQREIALERERKAALLDYLFSHGTKGEPRKQTEIGEIPESWEVVELNKVCFKIVDCPHSTPKFLESGVLCARNFNIRSGIYVREPASYTSEEEYLDRVKGLIPQEDDVLFSREAPIGEAGLIPPDTKLSLGQRMMLLRVNPLILNGYFLVQSFYVTPLRSKMLSLGRGVTAKHLNVRDVKRLEIPIPSFNEQTEIAEILQACDTKITTLEQETARLEELFHAILDELMTGNRSAVPLIDAKLPN